MSQAFYRKWRPRQWNEVVGQEPVTRTLQNAIRGGRIGHAYLLAGPRGTGKTTTARLLAKAVNCTDPDPAARPCDHCENCQAVNAGRFLDLVEIDAASNTSVDDVRDLRDKINYAPSQGQYKVYIVDEVHMLSTAAFNALLKTLEEPPAHAIFILATTEVHKIPPTVLSRCQRYEFRRIPVSGIVSQLKKICVEENLQVDDDTLLLIARQATGAMRDAISLLDQLTSTGEQIDLAQAQQVLGTATNQTVIDLVNTLIKKETAAGLDCIHDALDSGTDPRQFARQVVEYLRSLLLIRLGNPDQIDATEEIKTQMAVHASAIEMPTLLDSIRRFNSAATELRAGWQPSLLLELALAESILPPAPQQIVVQAAPQPAVVQQPAQPYREPIDAGPRIPPQPAPEPQSAVRSTPQPFTQPSQSAPAAAVQAAPAATPAVPSHSGGMTLADINQNWGKIRAVAKKRKPQAEAMLNSCKVQSIKDGVLVLGFVNDLLRSKMEQGDNVQVICEAIREVTGVELQISCTVQVGGKTGNPAPEAPSEGDGMVNAALNLGGQIVHKKPQN